MSSQPAPNDPASHGAEQEVHALLYTSVPGALATHGIDPATVDITVLPAQEVPE